jgi:hypothetical protein
MYLDAGGLEGRRSGVALQPVIYLVVKNWFAEEIALATVTAPAAQLPAPVSASMQHGRSERAAEAVSE